MADISNPSEQKDWLGEPKKLPDTLNVLTILTFIGCGIAFIFYVIGFVKAQDFYDSTVANQDKIDRAPDWVKSLQGPDPIGTARHMLDNKMPIFLLGLVATFLCLYGAIQMRQWKKSGFTIYTIGELLPFVTTFLFISGSTITRGTGIFSILIAGLFIILYATQLKYLKK